MRVSRSSVAVKSVIHHDQLNSHGNQLLVMKITIGYSTKTLNGSKETIRVWKPSVTLIQIAYSIE